MKNRLPKYPGRVRLVPVPGQANTFDMVRADEPTEAGTSLSKHNLLKDATAAMFGLDAMAVPDDVFAWLGKYNLHCWESKTLATATKYADIKSELTSGLRVNFANARYATDYTFDRDTGAFALVDPLMPTDVEDLLTGCYVLGTEDGVQEAGVSKPGVLYYIPAEHMWASASDTHAAFSADRGIIRHTAQAYEVDAGEVSYVYSENRDAYPDDEILGDFQYRYLGIPFENIRSIPKVVVGTYIGTGTYGSNEPCELALGFIPAVVFVYQKSDQGFLFGDSGSHKEANSFMALHGSSRARRHGYVTSSSYSTFEDNFVWEGTTFKWYSSRDSEYAQLNATGIEYGYVAIGM